jgi:hypothetical protein
MLLIKDIKVTGTAMMCFVSCFPNKTREHQVFDM